MELLTDTALLLIVEKEITKRILKVVQELVINIWKIMVNIKNRCQALNIGM